MVQLALIITLFFLFPGFVSAQSIATGLVGHWKFDEGSGTIAADSSGNNNAGTLTNGPIWTIGKINNAINFDGVDDSVSMGNPTSLNLISEMSAFAWIYPDDVVNDASGDPVISSGVQSGPDQSFGLLVGRDDFDLTVRWADRDILSTSGNLIRNGQYYHVGFTRFGSTGNWTTRLYVNGVLVASGITAANPTSSTGTIKIAQRGNALSFYDGLIDDVRVYNRALTVSDIQELYNLGNTPPPSPSDITPPILSGGSPTGTLPSGTTSATISVSTNENATCRYGTTPNIAYGSLPSVFSSTGGVLHQTTITGLQNGQSYIYYVRCQDSAGNETSADVAISFSVASPTAPPPTPPADGTYYVSSTGSDANLGSISSPFQTIQKAVDLARAGNTIFVRAGTYNESVWMKYSGVSGSPITLKNYPGETPRINGPIGLVSASGILNPISWIVIEGFEINNPTGASLTSNGIVLTNATNIIIRGNTIHDSKNQGIGGNGYKITIDRNTVSHTGLQETNPTFFNLHHGIYLTGTFISITNNIIHSNLAYGIQIAAYPYDSTKHAGVEYAWAKNWLISNNVIAYQKNRSGIVVWQAGADNNIIQNNIFYDNSQTPGADDTYGILFYNGVGNIVRNNLFYSSNPNKIAIYNLAGSNAYTASNNLMQQDPAFVNASAFDFHPLSTSPAINAGTSDQAPSADFSGVARPQGSSYDIGAYEVIDIVSPPPQPLLGDLNNDHTVNSFDWNFMVSVWFTSDTTADINRDGIVNTADYFFIYSNWGKIQ